MTFDKLKQIWGGAEHGFFLKKTAIMVVAGLILGVITPYDSSEMPVVLLRYAYWLGTVLLGFAASVPVGRRCFDWMTGRITNVALAFVVFCAAISVPIFGVVLLADLLIYYAFIASEPFSSASLFQFLTEFVPIEFGSVTLGYIVWYLKVLVIVLLIYGATSIILERSLPRKAGEDTPRVRPGQVFLNRLPPRLGTDLTHLSMEGHYVRAHTGQGDALIHMRMADALVELADYDGMQVHRSHWLAFDALERVVKDGRRRYAVLKTGSQVPVSQTYYDQMKGLGMC